MQYAAKEFRTAGLGGPARFEGRDRGVRRGAPPKGNTGGERKKSPPQVGPPKRINKETTIFCIKPWVLKLRLLAFPGGPEEFREVRGAGRSRFHLSWYLLVSVVTN